MDQFSIEKLQQFAQQNPLPVVVFLIVGTVVVILLLARLFRARPLARVAEPIIEAALNGTAETLRAAEPNHEEEIRPAQYRAAQPAAVVSNNEIARLEEQITFTFGGGICLAFLSLSLFVDLMNYATAANILQQAVHGLWAIGAILLFGGGAALGRRRTYIVRRLPGG